MKTENILIIGGGIALSATYLIINSNKSKQKIKSQTQAKATEDAKIKQKQDADKILEDAKIRQKQDADKILEDAKIRQKQEDEAKQELTKYYSVAEAGVKGLDIITKANTIFAANPTISESMANKNMSFIDSFKNLNELKTRGDWVKNYSSIYKDIKDYYSSMYKDNVDKLQDILPKLIVAKSMGNFSDKSKGILTSKDEIYLIDNNLNKEDILKNALKLNYGLLFPDLSNVLTIQKLRDTILEQIRIRDSYRTKGSRNNMQNEIDSTINKLKTYGYNLNSENNLIKI